MVDITTNKVEKQGNGGVKGEDKDYGDIPLPPDGGWGWMIVFGSFMIHVICDGIAYTFGIFVSELSTVFDSGKGEAGGIAGVMVAVTLSSGPVVSALTNKYGCRPVCIAGAFVSAVGLFISIFAKTLFFLYFSVALVTGIGFGLIYLPAIVSVGFYFEEKRALATGLAVCGSGVGTLAFAPLARYLIDHFDWRGALMILSAINLNAIFCGALFRPIDHSPLPESSDVTLDDIEEMEEEEPQEPSVFISQSADVLPHTARYLKSPQARQQRARTQTSKDSDLIRSQPHLRKHPFSQKLHTLERKDVLYTASLSHIPMYRSNREFYTNSVLSLQRADLEIVKHLSLWENLKESLKAMVDLSLLKDWFFILFAVSNFFTSIGFNSPFIYIEDRAKMDLNIEEHMATNLVSAIGIANMAGRILFGLLANIKSIDPLYVYSTGLTLCGLATCLSPLCTNYFQLLVYACLFGFFIGAYVALTSVVLVEYMGLDKLTSSFGMVMLSQGLATFIGPFLIGKLYDFTGSYNASFIVSGVSIGISGIMLFFTPLLNRCTKRSQLLSQKDIDLGAFSSRNNIAD